MLEMILARRAEARLGSRVEGLDQLVVVLVDWRGPVDGRCTSELVGEVLLGLVLIKLGCVWSKSRLARSGIGAVRKDLEGHATRPVVNAFAKGVNVCDD